MSRPTPIPVVGSWAESATPLSAFDAALLACGTGNVNLVALSSIIPPGHRPFVADPSDVDFLAFGDLTHVVMAEHRALEGTAVAGLAWVNTPGCHGGLFLEGHGTDAQVVGLELRLGLQAMIDARPEMDLDADNIETCIVASPPVQGPVSAVVVAVFQAQAFNQPTSLR